MGGGFFTGQGQQAPQQQQMQGGPMGVSPMAQQGPQQAPQQPQDPRSQYLAAAMQAMGKQPQGNAMGLGSNLLANALDQYALQQRQQQMQQAQGAQPDIMAQMGIVPGGSGG